MIARIDDELHARLKQRAAEQNRSLNDLVASILASAVGDDGASMRRRIDHSGFRVYPARTVSPPVRSRTEILERTRGAGPALSEALAADRDAR